jgi:hypothetical protein
MGTSMFMFEAFAYLSVCAYFYMISKWWHYVMIPSVGLALFGSIFVYFLPESPRFLVSANKFDRARAVFKTIAKWNGVKPELVNDFVFKEELEQKSYLN